MSTVEFIIIIASAVGGFWLVSFVIDAMQTRKERAADPKRAGEQVAGKGEATDRKWFEVLCVSPTACEDEIKSAYRERARLYHPDRVASLGDEFKIIAEQKMKELNVAYAQALRGR